MGPVRILVVEDEALVALDLKRRLTGFGYEVIASNPSGTSSSRSGTGKSR